MNYKGILPDCICPKCNQALTDASIFPLPNHRLHLLTCKCTWISLWDLNNDPPEEMGFILLE